MSSYYPPESNSDYRPKPIGAPDVPPRSCNRHKDCDEADAAGQLSGFEIHHCHIPDCEDCLGR